MSIDLIGYAVISAFLLDLILGDPRWLPHPIRWMGAAIIKLEPWFRRPSWTVLAGGLFAVSLIFGTWAATAALGYLMYRIHPVAGFLFDVIVIFFCLSARSLDKEATSVYRHLTRDSLERAKEKLKTIVGREVDRLDVRGVSRATVETVAENLVDGVISPLFYAVVGGSPLALTFKMVNTLDSMIGYRNQRYIEFGKVAARIDDVANYLPARISVPIIAVAIKLLSGGWRQVFELALAEGRRHASPNAGYPEAAFAGGLGVRLGGPNRYGGQLVEKPYIGGRFHDAAPNHIVMACDVMFLSSLLWVGSILGLTIIYGWLS